MSDESSKYAATNVSGEENIDEVPTIGADEGEDKEPAATENWQIDPATFNDDPLLNCLIILTRIEHRPFTAEALSHGLPLDNNRLTPELFVRAAQRAGLSAQVVKRELEDISSLVLPAVLLLENKQACILTAVKENGNAEIIQPEAGAAKTEVPLDELKQQYVNYSIFIRPVYHFEKRTDEEFYKRPKHWFWGVLKKIIPIYSEVIAASFLINLFALASPLFIMNVYDRVVPNNAIETLTVLAIGVIIVFSFDFLMKSLRGYFIDIAGKKADVLMSAQIYEQMLGIKMGARPESVGSFANTINQFDSFREFFTSATISTLIDLPFIFLFILVIYYIGGPLALVALTAVPVVIIAGLIIQVPLNRHVKESYRYAAQKHSMLIESLTGAETLKSMAAESGQQRKWEHVIGMASKVNIKVRTLSMAAINFSAFAQQIASVIVVIVGVYIIAEGEITMGALIACTILTGRALAPLAQLAGLLTRYQQSMTSLTSLDNIMKLPVERPHGKTPLHRPHLKGEFEFRDVSFSYPRQELKALDKVSFKIRAGEHVAIIGRIGSGKTTIEKLMMGLYSPDEGSIMVDGTDINQIDPATLRRNIGYMPQDITLFYGSIKDNIVMGAPYVEDSQILKAANLAGVTEFVSRNPQGFDTAVGERGEQLSGGQRQSVAVARACLLEPPILIFDEPTNAMDNRSEELFKARMKSFMKNKTLVLVTHKGSLLSLVERLILIDNGVIVADGPRDMVLKALSEGKIKTGK